MRGSKLSAAQSAIAPWRRGRKICLFALCAAALPVAALANTYHVNQTTDDGSGSVSGSLSWAINQANAHPGSVIDFSLTSGSTITINGIEPMITSAVTINGSNVNGLTIDGQGKYRAFFVNNASAINNNVTIENLSITRGMGQGGSGGDGFASGGGGLGAGGGLFVGAGNVSMVNVGFTQSAATGGNGGNSVRFNVADGGGGGGGLNGNGGNSDANNGAGGGGYLGNGSSDGTGGSGGGGHGGTHNGTDIPPGNGGTYGGGGGAGTDSEFANGAAGNGGFAGGGGGGADNSGDGSQGGTGGFGAGGGGGGYADIGSNLGEKSTYGGGAGGDGTGMNVVPPEYPGGGGGGGGAAFGGAVFVRQGATVSFTNTTLDDGTLTAGTGGKATEPSAHDGTDGSIGGSSLFLMGGNTTFNVAGGQTSYVHGSIAEALFHSSLTVYAASGLGGGKLVLQGDNTFTGGTTIDGATLSIDKDSELGDPTGGLTMLHGGTLATTATLTTPRAVSLGDGGGVFDVANGTTTTLGGIIGGAGGLTKSNTGTLLLTNSNTYLGTTTIKGGTISISADDNLGTRGGAILQTGGTLATTTTFTSKLQLYLGTGGGNLDVADGTTATWNAPISGFGALTKTGTGTLILQQPNNFTGNLNINAGTVSVDDDDELGNTPRKVAVAANAQLQVTNNITSSRSFTVAAGGKIAADNKIIHLTGSITNHGDVTGTLSITNGGIASGDGTYGNILLGDGGTFHPGDSPGAATSADATWGPGGAYDFDIDDASGDSVTAAGTNWSLWNITDDLTITANQSHHFDIDINSVLKSAPDTSGNADNFDPNQNYSWEIASVGGTITGFNSDVFTLDSANFTNATSGAFSILQSGNRIFLDYTANPATVPLPMALYGGLGLLGALGASRLRRCKNG